MIRILVAWSTVFVVLLLLFGALYVLAYVTGTPLYTFGVAAVVAFAASFLHRNASKGKRWAYRLAGAVLTAAAFLPIGGGG